MTTPQRGRIFISYRRADSAGYAGRIYDRLSAHFGKDAIFMDVDTIQAGLDFVDVLENAVQSCDVVVALLGRQWLLIKDEEGKPRLENPQDFVRIEVATALGRGIRVIPVLVDGTSMPNSGQLPSNLKPLARRNAVLINHYSFHTDADRLIEQLELALKAAEDSKILNAKKIEEEEVQKKRQVEIKNLLSQADIALDLQDWELAKEKLVSVLGLESENTQAQIKLAIVERKQQEIKEQNFTQEKVAIERAEREVAKKAARKDVERIVKQRKIREIKLLFLKYTENNLNQLRSKSYQLVQNTRNVWKKIVNFFRATSKSNSKIYIVSTLAMLLVVTGFILYTQINNNDFYFSGMAGRLIYLYTGELSSTPQHTGIGKNWLPASGAFGKLYFTSNRDGKAEIYELINDGTIKRITNTPGDGESWAPTVGAFGRLYFTSNRDGKAEIYEVKSNGSVQRLTNTPGTGESWSPSADAIGRVYFASNRDGKTEIYEIGLDGKTKRVTNTPNSWESWSPSASAFGRLFFTSNRSGKAEIFELLRNGDVRQYTSTPGTAESWSPVISGGNIYFTSNRDGINMVYTLTPQASPIVEFESWTKRKIDILPNPLPY